MSYRFMLTKEDWIKIAKGAGIAALGALSTYLTTEVIPNLEGEWTLALFVVFSTLINALRKWLAGPIT